MPETRFSPDAQHRYNPVKSSFWHTYLGLILQLSLFAVLMAAAVIIVPIFYDPRDWENLFKQSVPYAIMALALVLPSRLKGIDLSAGAVFAVSGWVFAYYVSENMLVPGLILALAAGLALGAANGTIQTFIRVPSAGKAMTVSAAVSFGITLLVSGSVRALWSSGMLIVQIEGVDITAVGAISLAAALLIVLAMLYFTKLGGEGAAQKRHFFMAYAGSGLIFSLAACCMVMRLQVCSPNFSRSAQIFYLLFIAGAILVSRTAKIRIMPVVCALMAALNWSAMSNILTLCGVGPYFQSVLQLVLTAAFMIPAFLVQRGSRTRI